MSDHEFLLGVPKKEPIVDSYKDEEEEEEDEDESITEGLHDDHKGSLQQIYNNGFPIGYQTPSIKGDLKKNSSGKRLKPDDEEEDVKIESYIQRDVKSISVKDMRKLVPKLRIECFYTEQELSGKKKMKHLWDQKPASWPSHVPFKDPNNPGKEGTAKKPGKNDLMKMYTYLRDVYLKNKGLSYGSTGSSPTVQVPQQQQPPQQYHVYHQDSPQTYYQHPYQPSHQLHQQHNMQQHFSQQFHPQLAYSPSNELSGMRKLAQPESMDEGQLIPSQVELAVTGRMTNMSCTPSPPNNITNGNVAQEVVKEEPFIIPNVVKELYNRIDSKVGAVIGLQGVTDNVREQLLKVIEEVLNPIYNLLKNTSFCLMYLDAGHQMEALLDCMIVLGKVEANLLSSGCIEIKKKFQNFEVWHVSSFIPKSLSYAETSQSCVTDCVKFRIRDHQNANIPIDQREINQSIFYEPDKNVQKFAMQEISQIQEIDTFYLDFNKVELQNDNSPQIEDMNLLEDLDLGELNNICENESQGNLLDDLIYGDFNSAPTGQFDPPEWHPQIHQTSSVPICNDDANLLLNDSRNPFLSSSSSLIRAEDFANLVENISSISSCLSVGVNQPFMDRSSHLFSNNTGFGGQSAVSETSFSLFEEQGRSCHAQVIPKFVEDMDCSDDYAACDQKTSRQSKRKKK